MSLFKDTESTYTKSSRQDQGIVHLVHLILIICLHFLTPHSIATAQTVHFPDPNLRAALEGALGKEVGDDITQVEMASLASLYAFESGIQDLTGLEFAVNLTGLRLGLNEISDLSALRGLTSLKVLDLHRNRKISDLSPLRDLTQLTWLSLRGNKIVDVSPLKDLRSLTYLHVGYNNISDVTPLQTLINLKYLDIELNRISDLLPISALVNLIYLDFDTNWVSDLSPLKTLTELIMLDASDNRISDISALKDLTKLTWLDVDDNQISDISSLSTLTNLIELDLDDNQILDVSPLRGLTKLVWLDIDHSRISDISPLTDLINLTYLDLNDNKISDVTPLKDMINLTDLDLDGNRILDITPLKNLTNLILLDLHGNKISDITPLKDMTKLTVLDLDDNQISDIIPLKDMINLTDLDLDGNKISDVTPLKDMTKLTILDLHDNHILDFSPIAGLIENLVEYDNSNQTAPPFNSLTNNMDVNRDAIVNVTDLVLVASYYQNPDFANSVGDDIYPDVNDDGGVDIKDIVAVASEIDATAATPTGKNPPHLTVENLKHWIHLAKQLNGQEPHTEKGIAVLEQLLTVLTGIDEMPEETGVLANFPNPFNPETWIPYQLAKPAKVSIFIHAADGKLVRTLALGHLPAGVYHDKSRAAFWDGRNNFGESVASGVYFYTLTADDFSTTHKMLIRK